MPFKIVIRNNLKQTADDFDTADTRYFGQPPVTVGSADNCACKVDDAQEVAASHFAIEAGENPDTYVLRALERTGLYLDNAPVADDVVPLTSGDEIRVGHLTFRFQNIHRNAQPARRADLLAIFAKFLIACILLAEIAVVYWLPRKFQTTRLLAQQIQQQESIQLLDRLRQRANSLVSGGEMDLTRDASRLFRNELDALAMFIRDHEGQIQAEQWQTFRYEVTAFQVILDRLHNGEMFPPMTEPDAEAGVQAVLSHYGRHGLD